MGILFLQLVGNCIEVSSGSCEAHARLETSHDGACGVAVTHREPEARTKKVESLRHDSDKSSRLSIQYEDRIEDLWITCEFTLPEAVVHDEHRWSGWTAIFFRKRAAEERRHSQKFKRVGRYLLPSRPVVNVFAVVV